MSKDYVISDCLHFSLKVLFQFLYSGFKGVGAERLLYLTFYSEKMVLCKDSETWFSIL
jgi:hypothetical protein